MSWLVSRWRELHRSAAVALILVSAPAVAQEQREEEEAPEPLWKTKLGLSYVATTGNTETTTVGSDLHIERRPVPWGLELFARYDRAEDAGTLQSERAFAGLRGRRALGGRWELFAEGTGERDEFAGFDSRLVLAAGGSLHALLGPRHVLDLDLGLSWTDEDRLAPQEDESFVGGLVALSYAWSFSERAGLGQRLSWFPNFETSSAWRLESFTTVEASLTERLALRLAYEVRYHNQPIGGREGTDTTTRMSVVASF